jgi:hypothetical protein
MALAEEFAARRARGERPDVADYLERAGDAAEDLSRLVEGLLLAAPPPPPSPEEVSAMHALLSDRPQLLVLRHRCGLTLDEVADHLVADLGLPRALRARVRALYQRLEGGLSGRIRPSSRLRGSLASLFAVDERSIVAGSSPERRMVFARGPGGWQDLIDDLPEAPLPGPASAEVDELFGLSG